MDGWLKLCAVLAEKYRRKDNEVNITLSSKLESSLVESMEYLLKKENYHRFLNVSCQVNK